jgi:hypothetical protein
MRSGIADVIAELKKIYAVINLLVDVHKVAVVSMKKIKLSSQQKHMVKLERAFIKYGLA